jgi:hypothetical protein
VETILKSPISVTSYALLRVTTTERNQSNKSSALHLSWSSYRYQVCRPTLAVAYGILTWIVAAEEFVDRIKAMQRELFILYLQYPRLGEQVVYQRFVTPPTSSKQGTKCSVKCVRPIGDLMVRDFYLTDARMSVIRNPTTGMYRLVLLNKLHSVSVCFESTQTLSQILKSFISV